MPKLLREITLSRASCFALRSITRFAASAETPFTMTSSRYSKSCLKALSMVSPMNRSLQRLRTNATARLSTTMARFSRIDCNLYYVAAPCASMMLEMRRFLGLAVYVVYSDKAEDVRDQ